MTASGIDGELLAKGQREQRERRPRFNYQGFMSEVRVARDQHRSRAQLAEIKQRVEAQRVDLTAEYSSTGSEGVLSLVRETEDVLHFLDDADHSLRDPVAEGQEAARVAQQERLRISAEAERRAASAPPVQQFTLADLAVALAKVAAQQPRGEIAALLNAIGGGP